MMKKKLVVLTGAGVSKESGLDTYRDRDGMWQREDPMTLVSTTGWRNNPQRVLDFHNALRRKLLSVAPNQAHHIIARLEDHFHVTVVTQNIDNLHERAGSSHVMHLHGELEKVCADGYTPDGDKPCIETRQLAQDIRMGDKAADGSQLRPYIVFFGEAVPMMEQAELVMGLADIVVVVGTSLQVYPAAGLASMAREGVSRFLVDPGHVDLPPGFRHIQSPATQGMAQLLPRLIEMA